MALNHPESLELWQDWARSRDRARRAKHAIADAAGTIRGRLRRGPATDAAGTGEGWTLRSRDGERSERLLIAVDSASPTSRASLLTFLPYLRVGVDVLSASGTVLPEIADWPAATGPDPRALAEAAQPAGVVSIGQHLGLGALAHDLARHRGIPEHVIQHGALTPFAPPLPHEATLLAWSDADGEFWRSGRTDVTVRAVGSQLLWQAAHDAGAPSAAAADPAVARPVFLGQMHGAELPRRLSAGTAYRFCRAHDALYRPHPAETDVLSRTVHAAMRRAGIELAPVDVPLRDLAAPVVGIFSTGLLEAAARGLPAWAWGPAAPGWVHEMWRRYDLRPFGGAPTPAPAVVDGEPAAHAARILEDAL